MHVGTVGGLARRLQAILEVAQFVHLRAQQCDAWLDLRERRADLAELVELIGMARPLRAFVGGVAAAERRADRDAERKRRDDQRDDRHDRDHARRARLDEAHALAGNRPARPDDERHQRILPVRASKMT